MNLTSLGKIDHNFILSQDAESHSFLKPCWFEKIDADTHR